MNIFIFSQDNNGEQITSLILRTVVIFSLQVAGVSEALSYLFRFQDYSGLFLHEGGGKGLPPFSSHGGG